MQTDSEGLPVAVFRRGGWRRVLGVYDRWVVEEGWWSGAEVRRLYFDLLLEGPMTLTVFRDLVTGGWYV